MWGSPSVRCPMEVPTIKWGTNAYALWELPAFTNVPNPNSGVKTADFQRVVLVKTDGQRYIDEMLAMPMPPLQRR
jgi:hypothetical protein